MRRAQGVSQTIKEMWNTLPNRAVGCVWNLSPCSSCQNIPSITNATKLRMEPGTFSSTSTNETRPPRINNSTKAIITVTKWHKSFGTLQVSLSKCWSLNGFQEPGECWSPRGYGSSLIHAASVYWERESKHCSRLFWCRQVDSSKQKASASTASSDLPKKGLNNEKIKKRTGHVTDSRIDHLMSVEKVLRKMSFCQQRPSSQLGKEHPR